MNGCSADHRFARALLVLAALVVAASGAGAKCRQTRIDISGGKLAEPLEITDRAVVGLFNYWNGPGVRVNDEPVHLDPEHQRGNFIDWPRGKIAARPAGLQRFEVTFHCPAARDPYHRRYVICYEFDPSQRGGFVSLPGPGDAHYRSNVHSIAHGVEGDWFHSTAAWESQIRPLIEGASAGEDARGRRAAG